MYTIIHTKILSYHTPMITFAWPGWKFLSSVTRALTNFTCRIEHNLDIKSIQVFNEYLPPCITVEAQECDSECPPGLNKSIKQGFTLLPVFIEKDGAMFVPFVVLMSDCFSFQQ